MAFLLELEGIADVGEAEKLLVDDAPEALWTFLEIQVEFVSKIDAGATLKICEVSTIKGPDIVTFVLPGLTKITTINKKEPGFLAQQSVWL